MNNEFKQAMTKRFHKNYSLTYSEKHSLVYVHRADEENILFSITCRSIKEYCFIKHQLIEMFCGGRDGE